MNKVSLVLGIRPDVIRASLILKNLRTALGTDNFEFIWSGQHYSDNMKDVFFRQLKVEAPDIAFDIDTSSDQSTIGSLITKLGDHWEKTRPAAAVFLGDTNTVCGSLAAASLNIPILHIEGCMRSYDWRMPEEKFRTAIDHLSDVIYSYVEEYKAQGVSEGIRPENVIVTGNPIVDVLQEYFVSGRIRLTSDQLANLLSAYELQKGDRYWVMTCHRRENVDSPESLTRILELAEQVDSKVIFLAGYKTQRNLRKFKTRIPSNLVISDPIGYAELLELISACEGVLTDSGTVVEETAVLGVPSVQMRTSTERPQVYDCGGSVKFDPHHSEVTKEQMRAVIGSVRARTGNAWDHGLGDGKASERIAQDIVRRFQNNSWSGHLPDLDNNPFTQRNFGWGLGNLGRP